MLCSHLHSPPSRLPAQGKARRGWLEHGHAMRVSSTDSAPPQTYVSLRARLSDIRHHPSLRCAGVLLDRKCGTTSTLAPECSEGISHALSKFWCDDRTLSAESTTFSRHSLSFLLDGCDAPLALQGSSDSSKIALNPDVRSPPHSAVPYSTPRSQQSRPVGRQIANVHGQVVDAEPYVRCLPLLCVRRVVHPLPAVLTLFGFFPSFLFRGGVRSVCEELPGPQGCRH